jgi:hypothetical protein
MFDTYVCLLLDDDECSRGSSVCPTNSNCRNTPGSYSVCKYLFNKNQMTFFAV